MSEKLLWEGESKDLASAATGGKVVSNRYRITNEYVYVDTGIIGSREEQIPLWAIRDVDIRQGVVQKARSVGDLIIRAEHNDYTGKSVFALQSIENPREVRDMVNLHAKAARDARLKQHQTVNYSGGVPMATPVQVTSEVDPLEKLMKLGDLLKAGLLTQEEFDAQKAKLLG